MGNVGCSVLGVWPILRVKSQDIWASAALILTILILYLSSVFNKMLAGYQVGTPHIELY